MDGNFISKDALCRKIHTGMNSIQMMQAIVDEPTVPLPVWVPVSERLPVDPDEIVLCSVTGKHNHVNYVGAHALGTYDDVSGWILEDDPKWENPPVTHWMVLPEPPEVKV